MTSTDGIFACGNVLQIHDLVDYVSDEARLAGIYAARYLKEKTKDVKLLDINVKNGVRYSVPSKIDINNIDDKITVRFRVDNVYKNWGIVVNINDKEIRTIKKRVMAPGEMEQLILNRNELLNADKLEIYLKEL